MKELPIKELLSGCNVLEIEAESDISKTLATPMPTCHSSGEKALLFISDKLTDDISKTDLSELKNNVPIAVVVSEGRKIINCACPIIRVENVRYALAMAVSRSWDIDYTKIKFIGVTGTNGKTTTATLIYKILSGCGYKVGFIGTGKIISCGNLLTDVNYSMTTPDPTLLYPSIKRMQDDGCEYVVMEVSSHSIALEKIAPINFEYSIFTNLDNDHLDFHHSKEDYFLTKLKLFAKSKTGLFNMDDEYGKRAVSLAECQKKTFGILERGDAFATDITIDSLTKSSFFYQEKDLIFKAETKLCGSFNIYNVTAALKCVIDLGVRPCIAKSILSEIDGVDGRLEVIKGRVTAVIDYAHTPMALYNCLKILKSNVNSKQNLILVFGCGGDRDKSKRPTFGSLAEIFADRIIITEDNSRGESFDSIADGIASGIKEKNFKIIKDRETAIRYAFKIAKEGDVVAVIGKGHERYKIVGDEYLPFDERRIIKDAMSRIGGTV